MVRRFAAFGTKRASKRRSERGVGAQDPARGVHGRDRHRGRVENAGEAHLGGAQILALSRPGPRLITSERDGPGSPSRAKATLCRMRTGTVSAVAGLQVDVEIVGRHFAGRAGR